MRCNVCKEEHLYGTLFRKKVICTECWRVGYHFDDEGNILNKKGQIIETRKGK